MKSQFILMFLIFPLYLIHAQENGECKVLVPALDGIYQGGCKDGLAHGKGTASGTDAYTGSFKNGLPNGKGTYTWASGDYYKGDWKLGKREGIGVLTTQINGKDSLLSGIWVNDIFIGAKPAPPKIILKYNVVSSTFVRTGDENKIAISFYQNGMVNNLVSLSIVASSGSEVKAGNITNFYDIRFPFHCKINYQSWNGLRTQLFDCVLEFEITQPGSWDLRVGN
jgi:hypothetical protein